MLKKPVQPKRTHAVPCIQLHRIVQTRLACRGQNVAPRGDPLEEYLEILPAQLPGVP
jgi:hypothetical protein